MPITKIGSHAVKPEIVIRTEVREKLTGNRTYYVRTDGNDSNTGLVDSAAGAFLTVQKAVNVIAETLDIAGYTVTVQVRDGTYTGAVTLKNVVGYAAEGNLVIQGNSGTPANVIISTTSADAFTATALSSVWDIKDLKIQTTTSGYGIRSIGSYIRFGNINFGACVNGHLLAQYLGKLVCISNYAISDASTFHWFASDEGFIYVNSKTITISGTPAFSAEFARSQLVSCLTVHNNTYSGSATGKRYYAQLNGVIYAGGTTLPGDVAGTTATGGQYA